MNCNERSDSFYRQVMQMCVTLVIFTQKYVSGLIKEMTIYTKNECRLLGCTSIRVIFRLLSKFKS